MLYNLINVANTFARVIELGCSGIQNIDASNAVSNAKDMATKLSYSAEASNNISLARYLHDAYEAGRLCEYYLTNLEKSGLYRDPEVLNTCRKLSHACISMHNELKYGR